MADEERDAEIERLKGRIAGLEGICAAILTQMVQGDADARRLIADDIRRSVERIHAVSEGSQGVVETHLEIARKLVRHLD